MEIFTSIVPWLNSLATPASDVMAFYQLLWHKGIEIRRIRFSQKAAHVNIYMVMLPPNVEFIWGHCAHDVEFYDRNLVLVGVMHVEC